MADEKPKTGAITYKQVEKAAGAGAREVWAKIGEITGAGVPMLNADGDAAIATTGLSDAKLAQIDGLLKKKKEN